MNNDYKIIDFMPKTPDFMGKVFRKGETLTGDLFTPY